MLLGVGKSVFRIYVCDCISDLAIKTENFKTQSLSEQRHSVFINLDCQRGQNENVKYKIFSRI